MDIFQKSIVPDKPRVLAEEKIYVYTPVATSTNAGIAQYNNDDFIVTKGTVSLKWPSSVAKEEIAKLNKRLTDISDEVLSNYYTSAQTNKLLDNKLDKDAMVQVDGLFAMELEEGNLMLYQNNLDDAKFTIGPDGYMRVEIGG